MFKWFYYCTWDKHHLVFCFIFRLWSLWWLFSVRWSWSFCTYSVLLSFSVSKDGFLSYFISSLVIGCFSTHCSITTKGLQRHLDTHQLWVAKSFIVHDSKFTDTGNIWVCLFCIANLSHFSNLFNLTIKIVNLCIWTVTLAILKGIFKSFMRNDEYPDTGFPMIQIYDIKCLIHILHNIIFFFHQNSEGYNFLGNSQLA